MAPNLFDWSSSTTWATSSFTPGTGEKSGPRPPWAQHVSAACAAWPVKGEAGVSIARSLLCRSRRAAELSPEVRAPQ